MSILPTFEQRAFAASISEPIVMKRIGLEGHSPLLDCLYDPAQGIRIWRVNKDAFDDYSEIVKRSADTLATHIHCQLFQVIEGIQEHINPEDIRFQLEDIADQLNQASLAPVRAIAESLKNHHERYLFQLANQQEIHRSALDRFFKFFLPFS